MNTASICQGVNRRVRRGGFWVVMALGVDAGCFYGLQYFGAKHRKMFLVLRFWLLSPPCGLSPPVTTWGLGGDNAAFSLIVTTSPPLLDIIITKVFSVDSGTPLDLVRWYEIVTVFSR